MEGRCRRSGKRCGHVKRPAPPNRCGPAFSRERSGCLRYARQDMVTTCVVVAVSLSPSVTVKVTV
jgi:hypothetical protein